MKHVFVWVFLIFTACSQKKIPEWNGKIYAGAEGVIERRQENEIISTRSPDFGNYICIEKTDFDCYLETYITNASGWERQSACGLQKR